PAAGGAYRQAGAARKAGAQSAALRLRQAAGRAGPGMSEPLMRLRGVSKVYSMGEVEVHALREVDLDILQGEFLVVVGQSGSGKSTLLNIVGGMDRPTSGSVVFGDLDLSRASDRQLTMFRRNTIGFVFQ